MNGETMSEGNGRNASWVVPLVVSVMVTVAGAGITWGAFSQRVSDLSTHQQATDSWVQKIASDTSDNKTRLAVNDANYAEILRRLGNIESEIQGLGDDPAPPRRKPR
jgi:hypothetical protein